MVGARFTKHADSVNLSQTNQQRPVARIGGVVLM
jgi:hypothetical protein